MLPPARIRLVCLLLVFLSACADYLGAQTGSPTAQQTGPAATTGAAQTAAPSPASGTVPPAQASPIAEPNTAPSKAGDLVREFARQEIETSSLEELGVRLGLLGLSTQGTRVELQARLLDYYKLSPDDNAVKDSGAANKDSGHGMTVRIDSAGAAQYMTLEQVDENYLRLSGGVAITVTDQDRGIVHKINADQLIYNRQKDVMTALGNVVYVQTQSGKDQRFTGKELDFSISDSDGIFLDGRAISQQAVGTENLSFSIEGDQISRSGKNLVVIDKSKITSSPWDPPAYHIGAKRIWLLKPGEWAIQDGLLYVGNVPMLPIPFFYYPSDELVFHPVLGYDVQNGVYLQTTWYIVGRKAQSKAPLSFMQLASPQGNGDYVLVPHGLFLERVDSPSPTASDGSTNTPTAAPVQTDSSRGSDTYLKILGDVYTKLGAFVGVQAATRSALLTEARYLFGIAFTRAQYGGFGSLSTTYDASDAKIPEHWESSRIGDAVLPFRFVADLHTQIQAGGFHLSLQVPFLSDPLIMIPFSNRNEDIDWEKLLQLNGPVNPAPSTTTPTGEVTNLSYLFSTSLSASPTWLQPFVQNINISRVNVEWDWAEHTWVNPPDPISRATVSAEREYFAPGILSVPDIQATISGTFFQYPWPAPPKSAVTSPKNVLSGLIAPWDSDNIGKSDDQTDAKNTAVTDSAPSDPQFMGPGPMLGSSSTQGTNSDFNISLGYTVTPSMVLEMRSAGVRSTSPSSDDFVTDYWDLIRRISGSLQLNFAFPFQYAQLTSILSVSDQGQELIDKSSDLPATNLSTLLSSIAQARSDSVTSSSRLQIYPFRRLMAVSGTSLNYGLDATLYRLQYIGQDANGDGIYQETNADWTDKLITTHFVGSTIAMNFNPFRLAFNSQVDLPPRVTALTLAATLGLWQAQLTANEKISAPASGGPAVHDPIQLSMSVPFTDWLSLLQNFTYDIDNTKPTLYSVNLKLWGLSAGMNVHQAQTLRYDRNLGWQINGPMIFQATDLLLDYTGTWTPLPAWKNRISTSLQTNVHWTQSLLQATNSDLSYGLTWTFKIAQFMDLAFAYAGENSRFYRYFAPLNAQIGAAPRDILTDLLNSIDFFDTEKRYETNFLMKSISVTLVHYLGDWQLNAQYTGQPLLNNQRVLIWDNTLQVSVAWKPIPEIKTNVSSANGVVSFAANP